MKVRIFEYFSGNLTASVREKSRLEFEQGLNCFLEEVEVIDIKTSSVFDSHERYVITVITVMYKEKSYDLEVT